jgi:hypothetical protein
VVLAAVTDVAGRAASMIASYAVDGMAGVGEPNAEI